MQSRVRVEPESAPPPAEITVQDLPDDIIRLIACGHLGFWRVAVRRVCKRWHRSSGVPRYGGNDDRMGQWLRDMTRTCNFAFVTWMEVDSGLSRPWKARLNGHLRIKMPENARLAMFTGQSICFRSREAGGMAFDCALRGDLKSLDWLLRHHIVADWEYRLRTASISIQVARAIRSPDRWERYHLIRDADVRDSLMTWTVQRIAELDRWEALQPGSLFDSKKPSYPRQHYPNRSRAVLGFVIAALTRTPGHADSSLEDILIRIRDVLGLFAPLLNDPKRQVDWQEVERDLERNDIADGILTRNNEFGRRWTIRNWKSVQYEDWQRSHK